MQASSAAGPIAAARDEACKLVKKQRVCEARVDAGLDAAIQAVQAASERLRQGGGGVALPELQQRVEEVLGEANAQTKELHSAVNKLGKVGMAGRGAGRGQAGAGRQGQAGRGAPA